MTRIKKVKTYSALAIRLAGVALLISLFWWLLSEFMWMCYQAGVKM